MEKRVPIAIVVHLVRSEDHTPAGPELTYTDNISAHGACVISSRQWKSGEMADVTSLNDRITLRGRVAYCAKSADSRYYVGLYFNEQEVTWNPYVKCRQSAEADDLYMGQFVAQTRPSQGYPVAASSDGEVLGRSDSPWLCGSWTHRSCAASLSSGRPSQHMGATK